MQAFLGLRPGVQLSLADDGESGLQLARRAPPDLLLVDLMMPTMSGLQVLQAVRQDPLLRHTPCLAVSANAMPHEISEALAAGFDGYLTKPLSTPVLLAEIDRVLGAH
jgi:CheY-like chemotaxis protein